MNTKPLLIALAIAATGSQSLEAATVELTSTGRKVLTADVPATTGLNTLYVADGMAGVTAVYTPTNPAASVTWLRFSTLGGGYAEPVSGVSHSGSQWLLPTVEGDMGYIVEEGDERTYFWVVDYSRCRLSLDGLVMGASDGCELTTLDVTGNAGEIVYYSINGRRTVLSRDLTMTYNTLEWNEETGSYNVRETVETLDYADGTVRVTSPLCATAFTLAGDRFMKQWGIEQSVTSPEYAPVAVEAHTSAAREGEKADNQMGGADDQLGGSAPAVVNFRAVTTDGTMFTEWQFSKYNDFEDINLRVSDTDFSHTFDELGTTYVRFVCDNADGTCQFTGDTYEINIGESALLCPNAFSPGASEGVNDEWRVSFKSIVSFECHIFNRWGQKMATLTHPSQGWDGKYGGKLVPAGVYYYVIKARGADGRKYDLSGDINIIDYK